MQQGGGKPHGGKPQGGSATIEKPEIAWAGG